MTEDDKDYKAGLSNTRAILPVFVSLYALSIQVIRYPTNLFNI